ncbi:MAG: YdeI/OmpD-associated family protein [Oscillospiraceae bacterium]|nr:YdeI/OmpD-associated family protein [Oscillospiraceae bacterium]
MGLSMALAKNPVAMNYFNGLSPEEQKAFVEGTHQLHSAKEMRQYVNSLCGNIK